MSKILSFLDSKAVKDDGVDIEHGMYVESSSVAKPRLLAWNKISSST